MKRYLIPVLVSLSLPVYAANVDDYIKRYGEPKIVFGDPPANTEWDWLWKVGSGALGTTIVVATKPNQSDVTAQLVGISHKGGYSFSINPSKYLMDLPTGKHTTSRGRADRRGFYDVVEVYGDGTKVTKTYWRQYLHEYQVEYPRK